LIASKAETLRYLKPIIRKSVIEEMYIFSVGDWNKNQDKVIKRISRLFTDDIIVRSSAIGEDSVISSQAGRYTSVLNINPKNKRQIRNAVSTVIRSYIKKGIGSQNSKYYKLHNIARQKIIFENNQILIQKQTKVIHTNGVILSRDPNSGSPYFIINYEQDNSTDSVTKGMSNKITRIYRNTERRKIPHLWRKLILAVDELEKILKNDKLDIEFAIDRNKKIIIFQVRALTQLFGKDFNAEDKFVEKTLKKTAIQLKNTNKDFIFLSDMADWNPAEIIGTNPNPLSYSLYDYLVMDYSWYKGRTNIGYKMPISKKLMLRIGNKPYVRLLVSFTSFFPSSFKKRIAKKLLGYYLKKISAKPYLHDKIEFYVVFSCFDFSIKTRLRELSIDGFSNEEIGLIKKQLIEFTNYLVLNFDPIFDNCKNSMNELEQRRKKAFKKFKKQKPDYKNFLEFSKILLDDCKTFGIIPFSTMARLAFVATALLNSLLEQKMLNFAEYSSIFNSINSPTKEFQNDMISVAEKKISEKEFMRKYGHLRPGTYDITVKRYDKEEFLIKNFSIHEEEMESKISHIRINKFFRQQGVQFGFVQLIDFIKKTIYFREKFKMEFSKNISDSLELIVKAGHRLGFTTEDISFLDINSILKYKINANSTERTWKDKIIENRNQFLQNQLLLLPPVINQVQDLYIIQDFISKPNFITRKSISGDIIVLKKNNNQNINNRIVVIENADPGFDWIFTKNPAGLITKYGGIASHMALRCAEIGLPAAIGCEQSIFSKVETARQIKLDCKNQQITVF